MNLVSQFTFCKSSGDAVRTTKQPRARRFRAASTLAGLGVSLALAAAMAACSSYEVRVNDNVIYTPAPLLGDLQIADEALRQCIERIIALEQIHYSADLTVLTCPRQGVRTLDGLEFFEHLEVLRLPDNQVEDARPLSSLSRLRDIDLSGNRLVNASPLAALAKLRALDISGNDQLSCDSTRALQARQALALKLPARCS